MLVLDAAPAADREKRPPESLAPEGGSLCLIWLLFGEAGQSFPQRIKRLPVFLSTAAKVDVRTPRVTETVSVNVLVFTGSVVETPF